MVIINWEKDQRWKSVFRLINGFKPVVAQSLTYCQSLGRVFLEKIFYKVFGFS